MKGKELKVSDQSFNSYNFSVVTAGLDWSRFDANPIMLFNHLRAQSGKKDDILPIGKWESRRVDGEDVYLTPVFDEADKFAAEIGGKYERGFLNGASLGILPLEFAAAPEGPNGEERIFIVRGLVMEGSLCDLPSNQNTVQFYDANEQPLDVPKMLQLAASSKTKLPKPLSSMSYPKTLAILSLATGSSDDQLYAAVLKLQTDNTNLGAQVAQYKKSEDERTASENEDLVNLAIEDGRIPKQLKEKYIQLMTDTPDLGRDIIGGLEPTIKLSTMIGADGGAIEPGATVGLSVDNLKYQGKTYMELAKLDNGTLKTFKANDAEGYEKFMAASFKDERARQDQE